MTLSLLAALPLALAADPVSELRTLGPGDGWSDEAERILVSAFDKDGSGQLDTAAEVAAMTCETWQALDDAVRRDWTGTGVRVIYGFDEGYIWVGDAFGMAEPLRADFRARAEACGVSSEARDAFSATYDAIQSYGGTPDAWDEHVEKALLAAFDRDGSGMLDDASEIAAVPCNVWTAVEMGTRRKWNGTGMRVIYGIEQGKGLFWVGSALGVDQGQQALWDRILVQCDVDNAAQTSSGSAEPGVAATVADIPRVIRAAAETSAFDETITNALTRHFDLNGTGTIDSGKELKLISCVIWSAIEDGTQAEWGAGLRSIYGFKKGFIWVGYAIGIDEKLRKAADKSMARCGLP